jgi:hypothetical protein
VSKVNQSVKVDGTREALRACNKLGKDANRELRSAARDIAHGTAQAAQRRGLGLGGLPAIVAPTVRAGSDRVPKVMGGGAKRVGRRRTPAGQVFFGAEFGGGRRPTTRQFAPHRGQTGYFLWPTIRARKREDLHRYQQALDRVCRNWSG